MTRYLMAGLAMTASVVLLFLASFRLPNPLGASRTDGLQQPVVAQSGEKVTAAAPGTPVPDERDATEAVAALREQIRWASQTLASLESQVTQTRQDLASLQSQKAQGSAPSSPGPGSRASQPQPGQGPQASPATRGTAQLQTAQQGAATPSGQIDSATPSQSAPSAQPSTPAPDAVPAGRQAEAVEKPARRTVAGGNQPVVPGGADPAVSFTQPLVGGGRSRPTELRLPDVRPSDARSADSSSPDGRVRMAPAPDMRAGNDDAAQAALTRLRRQSPAGTPSQERPNGAGEPHRVPTIERLADARAAVIEGRMDDARRFLQAAQVQLVFRAVGPGEDQPRVSQATGPISQALLALSTGDRGRAVIAIDQAAGALDANVRSRQFGSLPVGDASLLPPVPRIGP